MTKKAKQKITLDRPVTYRIKVSGYLDGSWSEWAGDMVISVKSEDEDYYITVLTGTLDQAALQGLLRRLYGMGMPLISVNCVKFE